MAHRTKRIDRKTALILYVSVLFHLLFQQVNSGSEVEASSTIPAATGVIATCAVTSFPVELQMVNGTIR